MKDGKLGAFAIRAKGGWGNQMLLKDCGIVPYMLHKNHGFRFVMVCAGWKWIFSLKIRCRRDLSTLTRTPPKWIC